MNQTFGAFVSNSWTSQITFHSLFTFHAFLSHDIIIMSIILQLQEKIPFSPFSPFSPTAGILKQYSYHNHSLKSNDQNQTILCTDQWHLLFLPSFHLYSINSKSFICQNQEDQSVSQFFIIYLVRLCHLFQPCLQVLLHLCLPFHPSYH